MKKTSIARRSSRVLARREADGTAQKAAAVCRPPMTAAEAAAVAAFVAKRESVAPIAPPKIETRSGVAQLSFDHASQAVAHALIANALGTGNVGLALGLLAQLTDVSRTGTEAKAAELDFMLRLVQGIGPQDEIEALLAVQMAAIHNATMTAARRLNHVENIAQQDSTSNALNKLARTFAAQVETFNRYRSGDEPTVKVQSVTVNEGGQAIVGNVQHGGDRETEPKSVCAPEPRRALTGIASMHGDVQALASEVQGAGGAQQVCVPLPRRTRRRANRLGKR